MFLWSFNHKRGVLTSLWTLFQYILFVKNGNILRKILLKKTFQLLCGLNLLLWYILSRFFRNAIHRIAYVSVLWLCWIGIRISISVLVSILGLCGWNMVGDYRFGHGTIFWLWACQWWIWNPVFCISNPKCTAVFQTNYSTGL